MSSSTSTMTRRCKRPSMRRDSGSAWRLCNSRRMRHLSEDTQQIAAPELIDPLLRITAAQHGIRDHGKIAYIAHPPRKCGPTVEVCTDGDVVFTHQLNCFIDHGHPVIHLHHDGLRHLRAEHGELRSDMLIHFIDGLALHAIGNARGIPEGLLPLRSEPVVFLRVGKLAADLEAKDTALRG